MGSTALIGWVVSAVIALFSIILLAGKGSVLILGYNILSKEKKALYDEKKLCRVVGAGLLIIAVIMAVSNYYMFDYSVVLLKIIQPWGIIAVIGIVFVLAKTVCKRKIKK